MVKFKQNGGVNVGKTIYYCRSCRDTGKDVIDLDTKYFSKDRIEFRRGYIFAEEVSKGNTSVCPYCNSELLKADISEEDYVLLGKATNNNRQLLDAMVDLHKKDVIEYELKMSQFRSQYEQSQSAEKQEQESSNNLPKCPTCGSTDLSKISTAKKVAKIATFGIFGMGDNGKTWKCNNCGSKF